MNAEPALGVHDPGQRPLAANALGRVPFRSPAPEAASVRATVARRPPGSPLPPAYDVALAQEEMLGLRSSSSSEEPAIIPGPGRCRSAATTNCDCGRRKPP